MPSIFQLAIWTISEPHQASRELEGSFMGLGWELSTWEVVNSTSTVMSNSCATGTSAWVDFLVEYLDVLLAIGEGALGISSAIPFSLRLWLLGIVTAKG